VLKGLGNIAELMKQAQQMGSRMQEINESLKSKTIEGTAGGGMITVEINGLTEVLRCTIEPKLIEQQDREMIEDLLVAATNQAITRAKQLHADSMKDLAGGFNLPGLDEALGQLGEMPNPPSAP
jgi:DNA-binding YbaB/EbfC family protein